MAGSMLSARGLDKRKKASGPHEFRSSALVTQAGDKILALPYSAIGSGLYGGNNRPSR
jgi:hypothetical protein